LSVGLHSFHTWFKDYYGDYSSVVSQFFNKLPTSLGGTRNVVAYEYWFDNDYAGRVNQNVGPQVVYDLNNVLSTIPLSVGLHTYHIHFLDDAGQWSSVVSQFFNKLPVSTGGTRNIVAYEYWFDNNYVSNPQSVGSQPVYLLNTNEACSGLTPGLHTYHIHFLDDAGTWSSVVSQFFTKLGITNSLPNLVTAYSYWFDMNSAGMTTVNLSVPVSPYNLITNIPAQSLSAGQHTVHFQFEDTLHYWSSVITDTFMNYPVPVAALATADTLVCVGSTVHFANNSVGGNHYLWNFGDTFTSGTFAPTHQYADTGYYSVTLIVTDSVSGYGDTVVYTNMVHVIRVTASVTPTGNTTFCQGDSVVLNANTGTGFSYVWKRNNNIINGATNVSYAATLAGNYTVVVSNSIGCSATSNGVSVIVNSIPSATITHTGNLTFCQGGSVQLTSISATSYLWNDGETTQNITVTNSGSFTIAVTDANGCNGASTATNVVVNPLPTPNITGTTSFCQGDSTQLSSNTGSSYLWNNGHTTQSIYTLTEGSYTVTLTDNNGCSGASSPFFVAVNSLPNPIITHNGNLTFCEGGSVSLSSNIFSSYSWSNGETTNSITVTNSGNYFVTVIDANGCHGSSSATNVVVYSLPAPTISGNTSFCQGDSSQLSSNTGSSYLWSNGKTTQNIYVLTGGSYTVTLTDGNGCTGISSATNVTVDPLPPTPSISSNNNILTSSATSGNQWLLNDVVITNAINQIDTALTTGCYKVKVTDGNGCTAVSSDSVCLIVTGTGTLVSNSGIAVFPNPNTGTFTLQINDANSSPLQYKISNALGQIIYQESVLSYKGLFSKEINLNEETNGVYFMEITLGDARYYRKVVLER
jgi:hypothetical protein